MKKIKMVVVTYCLKVKFLTSAGEEYMKSDKKMARNCYILSLQLAEKENYHAYVDREVRFLKSKSTTNLLTKSMMILESLDVRNEEKLNKVEPTEKTKLIELFLEKGTYHTITSMLTKHEKKMLIKLLRSNINIFAWSTVDMPGIHYSIIQHCLNVNLKAKPIK